MNAVMEVFTKKPKSYGVLIDAFDAHPKIDYLNKEEVELRKEEVLQKANWNNSELVHWVYMKLCPHFMKFTLLMPVGILIGMLTGYVAFLIPTMILFVLSTVCYFTDSRMYRWQRTLLLDYGGHVPNEGRQKALAILSRVPNSLVFVDHLGLDPFLVVVLLDGHGAVLEEVFFYGWDISPKLSTIRT